MQSDSNLAELKAIAKALEISKDLSITSSCESIFIELDSNIVLSWVADLNSVLWRTSSIINSIVNIPCLTLSSFTHLLGLIGFAALFVWV
ncbi:uncharacterized protein LOC110616573 isoform X2 [Manihot esculenta]|uniref:Uncharacterized protein n=1 Tax=Manihot esculenta TaxID=3983 RepID=A0ACB7HGH5_MANES|nr:uncharacterized protein LOC110616573 isoform X2 [Manihot esculenta]KAG8651712.1 hypothetical protein MANES_06G015450v8 [Manihot esculenta]